MIQLPSVSVCMITYNHENYIREAIEGVLMQECDFEIELIVANDCSTDKTDEVIQKIIKTHPNGNWVKYTNHTSNKGMMPNFIWALQQCKGKYIALCEGDDYWTDPFKLQKQVEFLEMNLDYGFCFTRFKTLDHNKNIIKDDLNTRYFVSEKSYIDFNMEIFSKGWHIGTQTFVFKNKNFNLNSIKKYKYFRDIHLYVELLKTSKGACVNSFDAVYRLHDGGIYASLNEFNVTEIGRLCYKELYYNNKKLAGLKRKYYSFNETYIQSLIFSFKYFKAFVNILIFSIEEKNISFFKKYNMKLLKKILK